MSRSLIPIYNQPLRFHSYPEPTHCKKDESYCYLHQPDDPIRVQFKQQPCSESVLCAWNFAEGADMVTNGGFTGSAASWNLGASWAYGTNNVGANGSSNSSLTQEVLGSLNCLYKLEFEIVSESLTGLTISLGGGPEIPIEGVGVHTIYIANTGNNVLKFTAGPAEGGGFWTGSLDNVSLVPVGSCCWGWDGIDADKIVADEDSICRNETGSVTIFSLGRLLPGNYYKITLTVTNYLTGNIRVKAGTNSSNWINSNGTYTVFLLADGGDFSVVMDEEWDGCVSGVGAYELRNDFQFFLEDLDGNLIADLSSYADYENDRVNISIDGLNTVLNLTGGSIDYGCYRISVADECAIYYSEYCGEDLSYQSNCIKYAESFTGTHLLIGNHNPDNSVKKYAFGFMFSSGFYLVQRLNFGFRKPKYPSKFERGKYSTQRHYKNFVETDKVWEMVFGEVSEIEHDAIAVMINCKQFGFLQDSCVYEYFNITEEYIPDWDSKGIRMLSGSTIEVMAIGDTTVTNLITSNLAQALLLETGGALLLE